MALIPISLGWCAEQTRRCAVGISMANAKTSSMNVLKAFFTTKNGQSHTESNSTEKNIGHWKVAV